MSQLKVLMISSEVAPFAKVGGLADVVGVLPNYLAGMGVDARVIMPLYKRIKDKYSDRLEFVRWSMLKMGWRSMYSGLLKMEMNGVTYYFIDNEYYFNYDSIYLDYSFDIERFCFFQRAVLEAMGDPMGFEPDILHCHDWQAGMVPVLLDAHYHPSGYHTHVKCVYTIHNLKYQGIHGVERIADLMDLPASYLTEYGVLKDGVPNFMKAGIVYSHAVTTVSPTYANEIMTDFYGEGLDGILRNYAYKLRGILNGIDLVAYNPKTDKYIAQNYDVESWETGKAACKLALQEEMSLSCPREWPLIGMITRVVDQKGLDLLLRILDELLDNNTSMVVLGTGDPFYENALKDVAIRRGDRFRAYITFDNALAHRIYAGSDMFMMPSLFEPCGLSQMISMRYGTVPIVRETGGLKDTVFPYNQFTGTGNGFSFSNINAHECLFTTKYACHVYNNSREAWKGLVESGMNGDFSWDRSADSYLDVYASVLERPKSDFLPEPAPVEEPVVEESAPAEEAVPKAEKAKAAEEKKK